MTESGLLVLQIIGGITFVIASIYICLKVAEDHIWVIWLLLGTVALWIGSFFVGPGGSWSYFAFALIIGAFIIGWFVFLLQSTIALGEWLIENWKPVLIWLLSICSTITILYFVVVYSLYSEFFYTLVGLILISSVIGKPPAVREFVVGLSAISLILSLSGLAIFGVGAVIHMSYHWGFSIFLEIGSDRFWLAWNQYILFSQLVFGILIMGLFALFMMPGVRLPTPYERMIIRDEERQAAVDDLEERRRRYIDSGGKSW